MRFYDDTCYCSRSYHNTNNNSNNSWVIVGQSLRDYTQHEGQSIKDYEIIE